MPESFGARLRRHRESHGISLSTIADDTKIKLSLLEGLERDDLSHWPSGIFRRAYLRAYAQCAGLSPDDMLREFLDVYPDPAEVEAAAAAMLLAAERTSTTGGPPSRLRYIVGSAIESFSRFRRAPSPNQATADGVSILRTPMAPDTPHEGAWLEEREQVEEPVGAAPIPEPAAPEQATSPPSVHGTSGPISGTDEPETIGTIGEVASSNERPTQEPDLAMLASLCTALGCADSADSIAPLLAHAAHLLDASGLIVWIWDGTAEELRPALAYGYSERVLGQVGGVRREDDNATAAAFRAAESCVIHGNDHTTGALALPLLTPAGCAGVLALELQNGGEGSMGVRASATILAAFLAQLVGGEAQQAPADVVTGSVHSVA